MDISAQVKIAVFERKSVIDRVGDVVNGEADRPGVRVKDGTRRLLARGYAVADRAGHGEGPRPVQGFGQVAGSLPEIEGRRVSRKRQRADAGGAGAAHLGYDADRGDGLMRGIQ